MQSPSGISLSILPADLEKLRRLQNTIQAQEDIIESLHHEQERVLQGYGVDLIEEDWELDLDRGTLSRK